MNKIIRWPGVAAFVIIFGGLSLLMVTFAEPLLQRGLSAALTRVNGAEVNIEQTELRWRPVALTLHGVQVTDPEEPTLNRFVAEQIGAELRFWDAIIGRLHITDLRASGIAMGTERDSPGRVRADYEPEKPAEPPRSWAERLADMNIEIPATDRLREHADLRTPALVQQAEDDFNEREARLRAARQDLPDSEQVAEYRERLDELLERRPRSGSEIARFREDFRALRDDIRADRDKVREFTRVSEDVVQGLRSDLDQLRAAPGEDLQRLQELVALDRDNLLELTGVLFGPQLQQWSEYALFALDTIGPMLQRAEEDESQPSRWEGRYIDFDQGRRPTFLIEQALVDMALADTQIDMNWQQVTWQNDRLGEPTTFTARATESRWWENLALDGEFFTSAAEGFQGVQEWAVDGARLPEQRLLRQAGLEATLGGARLQSTGQLTAQNQQLQGSGLFDFTAVSLSASGTDSWHRFLDDALRQVEQFELNLDLAGTVRSPRFGISSDLDNQLADLIYSAASAEAEQRLSRVRQDLDDQVESMTAEWQPKLDQFQGWREQGEEYREFFAEVMELEVDELIEQLGRDRLRDELRNRFGR